MINFWDNRSPAIADFPLLADLESWTITLAIASFGIAISATADTVTARCDVYPKGEDHATSSGLCTFWQRQVVVGIQR